MDSRVGLPHYIIGNDLQIVLRNLIFEDLTEYFVNHPHVFQIGLCIPYIVQIYRHDGFLKRNKLMPILKADVNRNVMRDINVFDRWWFEHVMTPMFWYSNFFFNRCFDTTDYYYKIIRLSETNAEDMN